jgi:polar amino acid transport system substrate-binding protein
MRALLLALICLLSLPPALACGPYRVGFYSFGRFYYLNAEGQPAGVDPDLIAALAKRSGCQLEGRLESRVRTWALLARGQLDLTVSGIATPERLQQAEFWPYLRSRNHVLLSRSLAQRVDSAEAFLADRSLRVGVVRSFIHGPRLDAWLAGLRSQGRVHEVTDFDALLRVLRAGRVDLVLMHPLNLRPTDKPWLEDFTLQDWAPQDEVQVSLVVSRSQIDTADRLRLLQAFRALQQEGEIDQILRRHLGDMLARQARLPP